MKLLFDQNPSHKLPGLLARIFPAAAHVRDFGLPRAEDDEVWDFARDHGFTIVSKDDDFHQRSFLYGHPPKVIGLQLGNCSTAKVVTLLTARLPDIAVFCADPNESFLALR